MSTRWHKRGSLSRKENLLLYKRFEESLALSQGLVNMEEMDSMQWHKLASEDLRQGGSLWVELQAPVYLADIEKMTFKELCCVYPKVAVEKISNDYKIYCEKAPKIDLRVKIVRKPRTPSSTEGKISFLKRTDAVRKPSLQPRNLTEVLLNAHHLEFFSEFLRERQADGPLQFLVAVQRMSAEVDEKSCKSIIENIMKTFFHGKVSPEEILQCDAPIIKEIAQMRRVSTTPLLALQDYVMKSLEEKWFKDYQELFPAYPQEVQTKVRPVPRKPSKMTATQHQVSQKRSCLKMVNFIKSFCKYRRFMCNVNMRPELEEYLHLEVHNNKENFSPPSKDASGRPSPHHLNVRGADENGDTVLVKRRILGHRMITVNFAINDLYFFSEMDKFNTLVSSAHVLQVNRAYNENDVILMRLKLNVILNLYLQSEVPPKLRVNISESQKDAILAAISEGHLDRSIFHGAIMSLFPVIMYFWKRFCSWRATRSYFQYKEKKPKDRKIPPKPTYQYPSWSGGDYTTLRFSLLRGFEWLRTQQRDVVASSAQNSSSSNLTQPGPALSILQLGPVPGKLIQPIQTEE